ncbi:hypothetical protein BKA93DRAFT_827866 [Sparassis latifolia]
MLESICLRGGSSNSIVEELLSSYGPEEGLISLLPHLKYLCISAPSGVSGTFMFLPDPYRPISQAAGRNYCSRGGHSGSAVGVHVVHLSPLAHVHHHVPRPPHPCARPPRPPVPQLETLTVVWRGRLDVRPGESAPLPHFLPDMISDGLEFVDVGGRYEDLTPGMRMRHPPRKPGGDWAGTLPPPGRCGDPPA